MNALKGSLLIRGVLPLALIAAAVLATILIRPFLEPETFWLLCAVVLMALLLAGATALWRDAGRRMTATLASMGDAVLTTDREGRITFLNPAAETLTGWPRQEAIGKPAGQILHLIDELSRQPIDNPLARASLEEHTALLSRSGAEGHRAVDGIGVWQRWQAAIEEGCAAMPINTLPTISELEKRRCQSSRRSACGTFRAGP